jgi:hypothetical protein
MGAVIEHVRLCDLPEAWRARVGVSQDAWVTMRIEEEPIMQATNLSGNGEDLLFEMWRDREDMVDVG